MHSSDFSIRLCTLQELDDIMDLQDRICAAITQPDLFASTCREENASYLTPPNVIYGVFKQKRLIAYASLAFPKDASDNLGWDLGWNSTQIRHCAKLDTIVGKMEFLMRLAVLAGPVLLLLMGLIYLFAAPKEANYYLGYRCYFGMGSVEAWRFTQRIAGLVWSVLGLVLAVVMLLISSGFHGKQVMDMTAQAVKCVMWQVAIIALACLAVNTVVAVLFDREGRPRRKKR